ncbi:hypothetical protein [Brevibacillus migulae]|uniref:hypothetical protein n=1 Tax=Brevibacillus migulae TaxID=1644114 RepID=UPI00106E77A6|nr:hypothetical protein [Brevibacillus migulae]
MADQDKQEVQVLDFEELLVFIEKRLESAGMKASRDVIVTILQAEEAFLMEKGVLVEIDE